MSALARVTLRSESTGVERRGETNADGEYRFDSLAPGRYSVEISATGFTSAKRLAEVTVAQPLRVDVTLSVGAQSESVTITGEGGVAVNYSAKVWRWSSARNSTTCSIIRIWS